LLCKLIALDNLGIDDYRMRLGVLGGTFDPIHNAHLSKAAAVARILAFDHILLVPVGDPCLKARPRASGEHRYAMAALAAMDEPRLSVSRIEIDRPGPSYSIDTLRELRSLHGERAQLFLIMGADVFAPEPVRGHRADSRAPGAGRHGRSGTARAVPHHQL